MSISVFLLAFGFILIISPNLFIKTRPGESPEDAVMNWMMNTSFETIMLARGMTIGGFALMLIGAALLIIA